MKAKNQKYEVTDDVIREMCDLASSFDFKFQKFEKQRSEIVFEKEKYKISIYLSRMTVGVKTVVNGKENNWFCKNVEWDQLIEIFTDPINPVKGGFWQKNFDYKKRKASNGPIVYNNSSEENPYF